MRTRNKPPPAPESDWPKLQEKHETNMVICGQDMVKKWLVMKPQYIYTHNHIHTYIYIYNMYMHTVLVYSILAY